MATASDSCYPPTGTGPGIQPGSPFFRLPLLAYDGIFSHLNSASIRSCRLVCSEWYVIILKLYSSPNCFYVRTAKYAWSTAKCLEENLKKSFETKVYEDKLSPVENLKLENVSIADCEILIEKSEDFRQTIGNVTVLNLTNAFFGDCPTFLQFLSKFKKLRKLVIVNGSFSSLIEMSVFHLRWYLATDGFSSAKLPETLRSLYIEVRQDCASAPLLFEILSAKRKDLKDFQLKVIPCSDRWFQKAVMATTMHYIISSLERTSFFVCWFVSNVVTNNEKTLKSLQIDWKMNGSNFILNPDHANLNVTTTGQFRVFFECFTPLLLQNSQLRLNELSLQLGACTTSCPQFNDIIVPFVSIQVGRELRRLTLSNLQSPIFFPAEMYQEMFPNFQDNAELTKFFKAMKMNLSMALLMIGTQESAQRTQTFLANKYSRLYIKELGIKITAALNADNPCTEFNELLPAYIIGETGAGDCIVNSTGDAMFLSLETLKIHLDLNYFKKFNICRISYQCPFLHVLEIVDGPISLYKDQKLNKGKISTAKIQDFDFRFIISRLKNLRSLTIWANMESITDFAITGCPDQDCLGCVFPDGVEIMKNFWESVPQVLQSEIKLEANRDDYHATLQILLESPISDLKMLQKLSLRGVGIGLTDRIISSFISEDNMPLVVGLERLEIRGSHKISKIGGQKLKKAINEVIL